MKRRSLCGLTVALALSGVAGEFAFRDCRATWTDQALRLENAQFVRTYVAVSNGLRTTSFKLRTGGDWQTASTQPRGSFAVEAKAARWSPVGVEGLFVRVTQAERESRFYVFPGMPGIISILLPGEAVPRLRDLERDLCETKKWHAAHGALMSVVQKHDCFSYGPRHVKATTLTCIDQTDIRDNLLQTDERLLMKYDCGFTAAATALDCLDVVSGEGLAFVRLAPMPISRPQKCEDFFIEGSQGRIAAFPTGSPLVELVYRGGTAGRQRAFVAFQRALRPYRPGRDGILLSNTWGAGNHDSRICQDFLLKEIDAGARLGVDVIQIDDGWQRGRTANSDKKAHVGKKKVWNGYWAADPDFWKEDLERFPDGLDFLVKKAREKGMRFGLWFGPDSSNDAANWARDADCLLDYHRRLGIDYFKMDSMKLRSPLALQHNRQMFDKMLRESDGAMVFDLDCTAEVRPGFFGLVDIGPLFLENRYTRRPIYLPHHTLKNLWDLSHVVDPVRLRVEFNNPDTNHANYDWTPLGHDKYRPDTLFAFVMAGSPLAWMELSDVSEASMAALAPLIARWKAERARWHGGVIHPVANRPDGVAWTGFVSEDAAGKGGYALLFRELNEDCAFTLDLKPIFGARAHSSAEVLAGRGTASLDGRYLRIDIPAKLDYIWVKFN